MISFFISSTTRICALDSPPLTVRQEIHTNYPEGPTAPVYVDVSQDGSTFGVADYGGVAQQFKFDDSKYVKGDPTVVGNRNSFRHVHCFRYVPEHFGVGHCMALASDLGNNKVYQLDCNQGSLTDMGLDLEAFAPRHIDFHPTAKFAVVVSENGEDERGPMIQSYKLTDIYCLVFGLDISVSLFYNSGL